MKLFVCPLLNGCSNTINSGSMTREIIFFFSGNYIWYGQIFASPLPFLPTIHRMYTYLQKVCYKPSFSNKYYYFAFNSINIRSEYGMYHFHGIFFCSYTKWYLSKHVLDLSWSKPLEKTIFCSKTLIYKHQMIFMMAFLHCDIISFKFTYLKTYIHYDFIILTFIKLLFWGKKCIIPQVLLCPRIEFLKNVMLYRLLIKIFELGTFFRQSNRRR